MRPLPLILGGECLFKDVSTNALKEAQGARFCAATLPLIVACVRDIRQHTSAYISIRQHTSAYVSIRQHTSAYVKGAGVSHCTLPLILACVCENRSRTPLPRLCTAEKGHLKKK
jgi:hypothetical protein